MVQKRTDQQDNNRKKNPSANEVKPLVIQFPRFNDITSPCLVSQIYCL